MGDRLTEGVHALEALCHRYLKRPQDEVAKAALLKGLTAFPVAKVTKDHRPFVRGLAAQCQAYAALLLDDLAQGKSKAGVQRLCHLLGELRKALD